MTSDRPPLTELAERALRDERLRFWVRGCLSKKRHDTEELAQQFAQRVVRRYHQHQAPYYCRECGGWHLSSLPEGQRS
jgi:hypothetical protein